MKRIEDIDKNFFVKTESAEMDLYDAKEAPFKIYGLFHDGTRYRRMPEEIAKQVNDGVFSLHTCTAGGRVRFKTDSNFVFIKAVMDGILKMQHITLTGSGGFDIYADSHYAGSFVPPMDMTDGYESKTVFHEKKMRQITINFPLYSNVKELYIGLEKGAKIEEAEEYRYTKPIVYYGSSITQGGCASRPGNAYQAIITRRMDIDHINLGFSGSAKGEDSIAEYIAGLEQSVFVMDYDCNAPNAEHLKKTHRRMYEIVRERNPELPIVFISAHTRMFMSDADERREIIRKNYEDAKNAGDENIYHINGREMLDYADRDIMTVDGIHPNDFGFWCIAQVLEKVLREIIK